MRNYLAHRIFFVNAGSNGAGGLVKDTKNIHRIFSNLYSSIQTEIRLFDEALMLQGFLLGPLFAEKIQLG